MSKTMPAEGHSYAARAEPRRVDGAPHVRALEGAGTLLWTPAACAALLAVLGWVFYGPRALLLATAAAVAAGMAEWFCAGMGGRSSASSVAHSLGMGLLVALMLPATAPWHVAAAGAVVAVAVGKWLMGGLGHYLWHPAVVGILAAYLLWPGLVAPPGAAGWPLLSRAHLVWGGGLLLAPLKAVPALPEWADAEPPGNAVGFAMARPETILHEVATGQLAEPDGALRTAVRDLLPAWPDMLIGAVPAAIGQGSTLGLVGVALVLIWRGYLWWPLPIGALLGAIGAAAVLPIWDPGGQGATWLPVRCVADGVPVGLAWVGYHALLGSTLFAAVMLAGETVTCPLTARGQIVYGVGVGALTVGLRWWPVAVLSSYWAVLAMNSVVPVIDAVDRRWRLLRRR